MKGRRNTVTESPTKPRSSSGLTDSHDSSSGKRRIGHGKRSWTVKDPGQSQWSVAAPKRSWRQRKRRGDVMRRQHGSKAGGPPVPPVPVPRTRLSLRLLPTELPVCPAAPELPVCPAAPELPVCPAAPELPVCPAAPELPVCPAAPELPVCPTAPELPVCHEPAKLPVCHEPAKPPVCQEPTEPSARPDQPEPSARPDQPEPSARPDHRRTPTKMTIPGIRSGPVTFAKAREPVDPAEARKHDDLWRRRESIRDSTPSSARSAPAAGRRPQRCSRGSGADRLPPLMHRNLTIRLRSEPDEPAET
ncbi:uncharacterized protein ACWYII_024941 [Salvelinus alpinus]